MVALFRTGRALFSAGRELNRVGSSLVGALGVRSVGSLVFHEHGDPLSVLRYEETQPTGPKAEEIQLRFLGAPINPADINTVEGRYPLLPTLPAIGGHEGLGEVLEVGKDVHDLKVGDWVIPLEPCQGTWRHSGTFKRAAWLKIPSTIPMECGATLAINPLTAQSMLELFEADLKPGDVVVQNGAASAVGQAVIQLAHARGLKTVNIIRNRPDFEKTEEWLKSLGATVVTTDARARDAYKSSGLLPAALGLNCVGGNSTISVAKLLRKGATLVTYGGMSQQPVTVPTSLLIFKDICLRGFWWSGNLSDKIGHEGKAKLVEKLIPLIEQEKFKVSVEKFPLKDFGSAIERSREAHRGAKVLLVP